MSSHAHHGTAAEDVSVGSLLTHELASTYSVPNSPDGWRPYAVNAVHMELQENAKLPTFHWTVNRSGSSSTTNHNNANNNKNHSSSSYYEDAPENATTTTHESAAAAAEP